MEDLRKDINVFQKQTMSVQVIYEQKLIFFSFEKDNTS